MNSIIYQITNKIDNKSYIGFTIIEVGGVSFLV